MKEKDMYKEIRTFTYPNAIVRVHIPDLAADERERRIAEIKRAAGQLLAAQRI